MNEGNYFSEVAMKDSPKKKLRLGLRDGSVTSEKIAAGSITAEKIADGTITANKLVKGMFDGIEDKLKDGSITTEKLKDGAVTGSKIANGSIGTGHIVDKSVTAEKLAEAVATEELTNAEIDKMFE